MDGSLTADVGVFKLLETELTREEFAVLCRLTEGCCRNPFVFSVELGEFVTDDDWGLTFVEEDEEDEEDLDEVANLIARCCDILTRRYPGGEAPAAAGGAVRESGRPRGKSEENDCPDTGQARHYSVAVSLESSDTANAFAEALRRNGYQYTSRKTAGGHLIEVGFSACSDYEHYRERDNIRLLLEVAGRKAGGTRFYGQKLT